MNTFHLSSLWDARAVSSSSASVHLHLILSVVYSHLWVKYCIFKCRCVVLQAAGVWYRLAPWRQRKDSTIRGTRRGENLVACNIWHLVLWVIWSSKPLVRFIGLQTEAELFKHPMVYYKTAAGRVFFLKCCMFVCRKMCVFLFTPDNLGRKPVLFFSWHTLAWFLRYLCKSQAELFQKAVKTGLLFPFVLCWLPFSTMGKYKELF